MLSVIGVIKNSAMAQRGEKKKQDFISQQSEQQPKH